MGRVGRLCPLQRPIARILDRQCGGDDQDLREGAFGMAGEDHSPDPGIDRQPRKLAAKRGQDPLLIDCAQLLQQRIAIRDRLRRRRFDERERLDIPQAERLHSQNHGSER